MMKRFGYLLSLVLIVACVGCSSNPKPATTPTRAKILEVFSNPDGSINYPKLIMFASYGIEADCAFSDQGPVALDVCVYGRPAIEAAQAINTNNPELLRASIANIFQQLVHDHPATLAWFDWLLQILTALQPAGVQ